MRNDKCRKEKFVKILFIRWKLPKTDDFSLRLSIVYDIIIQDVKQRFYMVFRKNFTIRIEEKTEEKMKFYSNSLYWWSGECSFMA